MYANICPTLIDTAHLLEQTHESYDEFRELIEPNKQMEMAIGLIESHLKVRQNYERAIFAISDIEEQVRHEMRFVTRFPGKVGKAASSALATLLECAAQMRLVI